ncbi:unnamed protein product [Notodromas monacha]|uniref:Uncharacterized protein n=1 Tax=Notodromas monacha TaxID=399045 RepID=A0A7R9C3V0_9CRUS|nr:unnamed protein product [Notodromas monacha]CAG0925657.1 unnamed protein product [Notodromas monacha]
MQYLANKYSKDHNLYPEDPEKRAIVDNRMFFESGTLFARIHAYVKFSGIHDFQLVKYEHLSAWMNKCKTEFKYYNDIVEKGALNWEEYFLELSEGKEMK